MHNLMTLENEELRFYSLESGDEGKEFKQQNIFNDESLSSLYNYYLLTLANPSKINERCLIEEYLSSLRVRLDNVINISRSLADFERFSKTKTYPYEIIIEGINNQRVFKYFCDNGLLHVDNKTYIKK